MGVSSICLQYVVYVFYRPFMSKIPGLNLDFIVSPHVAQVVRNLPSTETTMDQSLAVALMDGTWVECVHGCMNIYPREKKEEAFIT